MLRHVALDVGVLRRRREFRLMVISQLISLTGSLATFVAVPFQVYELTRSSLAVGLLGLAELAPLLALALLGVLLILVRWIGRYSWGRRLYRVQPFRALDWLYRAFVKT